MGAVAEANPAGRRRYGAILPDAGSLPQTDAEIPRLKS
jgi:hypothetical protein